MASYGFVYIMINEGMSNVFKIGCSERSPYARAQELSMPTGVPAPFIVLCYAELENHQAMERKLHEAFDEYRVSENREFFYKDCLLSAIAALYTHPWKLAFAEGVCLRDVLFNKSGEPVLLEDLPNGWRHQPKPSEGFQKLEAVA